MSKKFETYIPAEIAEEGLKSGRFVSGVLRVNPKKPNDGFCVTGTSDILIRGKFDRNRAFNGDTIVVELYPEEDWHRSTTEEEAEGMDLKTRGPLGVNLPEEDRDEILLTAADLLKLSGGAFVSPPTVAETLASKVPPPGVIKTGRVVFVSNCVWKERTYACSLQPNRMDQNDSPVQVISEKETLIRAVPIDKRIPWILIQLNDVVKKTLKLPGSLDRNILYPIQVQKWDESGALPLGRLKGVPYGRVGQPDVEAKVCMAEQGLEDHEKEFPESVYAEVEAMQSTFHNELEQEASRRIDLRKKRIFTIDPLTARDLDDAIHIDILNDEFVEVGVHIADVSHYVKEGSQTDKIAKERCTSVYLAHRVYPMLPEGLCNALCSLNPNEPKLTFTSVFRIRRSTGEVILDLDDPNGPRFAKTIIQSCCRFTYEEVQDVLDGVNIPLVNRPTVFGTHNSWDVIVKDLFLLYDICGKVRDRRFDHGSVRIDKVKMRFKLNEDDVPTGYEFESHSASHWMIEELMLLSNEVVAKKLCQIGESAVLRRHPPPQAKSFNELSDRIRSDLGLTEWDGSTSRDLFRSLQLVREKLGPKMASLIEYSVMKTMRPAEYCTQSIGDFRHYALAFDYYTHFTSPIRRYPDIMVHRQLQTVLEMEACGLKASDVAVSPTELTMIDNQCTECNLMKKKSREAQEACDVSFFCIYLRHKQEFNITMGTVTSITDMCFNVYVPKINKEHPVFFKLHLKAPEWYLAGSPKRAELDAIMAGPASISAASETMGLVQWTNSSDRIRINVFDEVKVVIVPLESVPISFALRLLPPNNARYTEIVKDVN